MKLGVAIFPTDYSIRPDDFARACEERGFESVWFPEHTHIPASRATPYPAGGDLPKEYWHTHDPFVALMAAAAVTKTIKLATGICLLIERDPIVTAKEVSSLDQLSGGRVLFGIGAGWNVEEMANHGTDFEPPLDAAARARRGDEVHLDAGGGRVPRRAGQLRSHLAVPEAAPEAASADHPGQRVAHAASRASSPTATAGCRSGSPCETSRAAARAARARHGCRSRPGLDRGVALLGAGRRGRAALVPDMGIARGILAVPPVGHDEVLSMLDQHAPLVDQMRA